MKSTPTISLDSFLNQVDAAVACTDGPCCYRVKKVLEEACGNGVSWLPGSFLEPCTSGYARRLVYKDPADTYSIMVMVWDKNQGTMLHDHAGMWCVECVYRGRIKVVSYDLTSEHGDVFQFERKLEVHAGPGEAGALIPPFDYHTLENDYETASVTIHIYGGEMTWCHAFAPEDDHYRRIERELCYTKDE